MGFVLLVLTTLACAPSGEAQEQPPSAMTQHMLSSVNEARSTPRSCGDGAYGAAGPLRLEAKLSADDLDDLPRQPDATIDSLRDLLAVTVAH